MVSGEECAVIKEDRYLPAVILANAIHRMWRMSREDMDVRSDQNPVKQPLT